MKRDFDLIRRIMIDIEKIPARRYEQNFSYDGFDSATINQHIANLIDAGLVNGTTNSTNVRTTVLVNDLTWAGHDFLDAMRDDNLWNKAKEHVLKPGGLFYFWTTSPVVGDKGKGEVRNLLSSWAQLK
ncbi:MAG: DUF2513 domain-containing protein [Deltaproteobacteria bacterium]|nr:DUF2513 domain-containing protein [Deltaproteobacteria bacterium]